MSARFARLGSNEWGVRVTGPKPKPGDAVVVSKAGGGEKTVVVTDVVGGSGGSFLCTFRDGNGNGNGGAAKSFAPTQEQLHALELFKTGKSLAIEAGAGTGKTSTLQLLAESTIRRGQYVAFNRSIVQDSAGKFPSNVACNTAHSLAMKAVGRRYEHRLNGRRMKSVEVANILGCDPVNVTTWTNETKRLGPAFIASLTLKAIGKFCMSADDKPSWRHVPFVQNLDAPSSPERPTSFAVNNYLARAVEPYLAKAWKDLTRYDGVLRYQHDHYLKLWQLSDPVISADFILFDEAQDANPVMQAIVAAQTHAQVVWVGDSNQEIYAWAGAVNALAQVPADERAYLTQSFRFGPAIADVANRVLSALPTPLRLTGTDTIKSVVEKLDEPDAVLARTNATALRQVLAYLDAGRKPYLVGGGGELASFARGARELMQDGRTDHPELACFDSWNELLRYVDEDEQGIELRLLVKLVDEFGVEKILDAVDQAGSKDAEKNADVIVSTAHKLASDFPEKDKMAPEELRLLYVAATRARERLDITDVPWFAPDADDRSTRFVSGAGELQAVTAIVLPATHNDKKGDTNAS